MSFLNWRLIHTTQEGITRHDITVTNQTITIVHINNVIRRLLLKKHKLSSRQALAILKFVRRYQPGQRASFPIATELYPEFVAQLTTASLKLAKERLLS